METYRKEPTPINQTVQTGTSPYENSSGRMTRHERAKQFMAFDAMKGLQEALRDREERHTREPRRIFCEEEIHVLDQRLRRLRAGMTVHLTYYCRFHECTVTDVVREVGDASLLIGHEWIDFADIYKVKAIELPKGTSDKTL